VNGGGVPIFGTGREKNGLKRYKIMSFDPFLDLYVRQKKPQNSSNGSFGPILGTFYLLVAFFAIIAFCLSFSVI
jgi:hypothetical protein